MKNLTFPLKIKSNLSRFFIYCFEFAIFIVCIFSIIFISGDDSFNKFNRNSIIIISTILIICSIVLIFMTFNFFKKSSKNLNYIFQIINGLLIVLLSIIITLTVQMNNQMYDAKYCIKIAQKLAQTMNWSNIPYGSECSGYHYALSRCYNMAPLIYLQALIFKFFSLIGIKLSFTEMITLGTYTNTFMLLLAIYLAFRLVKKHCIVSTQTGFTFLLLVNIPLYATVYCVYTDIPALLAIMVILNSYDAFIHTNITKNKIFNIFIIILASIIGALFKFNVLIALFAIIIHYILINNWKNNIKFILLLLIPTMLGISGVKKAITITSPVPQSELGLPSMNWVNMSFSKIKTNGAYNPQYFKHTYRLKKENKNNNKIVNWIEFKELIYDFYHRPKYYFYMLYRKIGATYDTGTYNFSYTGVKKYHIYEINSFLSQILYGNLRPIFRYFSFLLQISLFSIIGLGIWQLIIKRKYISFITPWMLALFGNMFMLLFWESRPRYLLPFVGTIYMIACVGIEQVLDARDQKKLKAKNK